MARHKAARHDLGLGAFLFLALITTTTAAAAAAAAIKMICAIPMYPILTKGSQKDQQKLRYV